MWDCRAQLVKMHDGDTFTVLADTMFSQRCDVQLRLLNVYAPELKDPGGLETTDFVNTWLMEAMLVQPILRWPIYLKTVRTQVYEPNQKMTFTRYLATVWRYDPTKDGAVDGLPSLNDAVNAFLAQHPEWGPGDTLPKEPRGAARPSAQRS